MIYCESGVAIRVENKAWIKSRDIAILRALSNTTTIFILEELKRRSSYTRELSIKLGLGESLISRKLRELERLGLVEANWRRRGEKTIREYSLATCCVNLKLVSLIIHLKLCDHTS